MVPPSVGAVVLIPFPFSDLSVSKLRPALVLAFSGHGDWVCAQITSKPYSDSMAVEISDADFQTGFLNRLSFVRPGKLFTANRCLFKRCVGKITNEKLGQVREVVIALIQGDDFRR